jgi:hypothetical protein
MVGIIRRQQTGLKFTDENSKKFTGKNSKMYTLSIALYGAVSLTLRQVD